MSLTLGEDLKEAGIGEFEKLVTMPLGDNKVLVRIENLYDMFDNSNKPVSISKVDLELLAQAIFKSANSNATDFKV